MAATEILSHLFADDGVFPNNATLPLLLYRGVFDNPGPEEIASIFRRNRWDGCWVNGIFDWHHYHSNAHEVLGCFAGSARVRFGGPGGEDFTLAAGDAVVIPAGVAHCNREQTADFRVVGAYPAGQSNDLRDGTLGEREEVLPRIRATPLPEHDPLLGGEGVLLQHWNPGKDGAIP